jgi:hypothetical protein
MVIQVMEDLEFFNRLAILYVNEDTYIPMSVPQSECHFAIMALKREYVIKYTQSNNDPKWATHNIRPTTISDTLGHVEWDSLLRNTSFVANGMPYCVHTPPSLRTPTACRTTTAC